MFDLKKEFEEQQDINDGSVDFESMDVIDNFLTTCSAIEYERDYEENLDKLELFQNVDASLTKFKVEIEDETISYESALSDLNSSLNGTGLSLDDLGLNESLSQESAILTVESADSWYVRLWNWVKEKIKNLYNWFMGLFDNNEAKLKQAETALNQIPSPEVLESDFVKLKNGVREKNKEAIKKSNKELMMVLKTAAKLDKEIDENDELIAEDSKMIADMEKELEAKLNNEYPVYWKDVKHLPGALMFSNDSEKMAKSLSGYYSTTIPNTLKINDMFLNIGYLKNIVGSGSKIRRDRMAKEIKKIGDIVKRFGNINIPFSNIYETPNKNDELYLPSLVGFKGNESVILMSYKLQNDGVPTVVENSYKSKVTLKDDYVVSNTSYKAIYALGYDLRKDIRDARKQKANFAKTWKGYISGFESASKNVGGLKNLDNDAKPLYNSVLKNATSSFRLTIKQQVNNVNMCILLTRLYLTFLKANTVKI